MANDTKVVITAETKQAEGAFKSLGSSVDGIQKKMFDLQGAAGKLGAALTLTAFAGMVKSAIDLQDQLSKLAQKTGTSVETLAGLKLAADQNGTSLESLANASKKLASNMAENPAIFKKFGITAKDTTGALVQLADIFSTMPDGVQKTALAVKLMGKNGEEMIPFLNQGGEALQKMVEHGKKLYPITADSAKAAEAFNDQLSELSARASTLGIALSKDLVQKMSDIVTSLDELSKSGSDFLPIGNIINKIFEALVVTGANVAYVFKGIGLEATGIATQLVALAHLDFKGFSGIGDQMKKDAEAARKEIDAFSERILKPVVQQNAVSIAQPKKLTGTGKDLLGALIPPKEDKKENTGIQVLMGLEKDYQNELAKRKDALNAPLLSASERALADDMRNVGKRAQDSRIELEKLYISGTLSLENYQARLQDVSKDEEKQRRAIQELAAAQDKLNASFQYGAQVALRNYLDEVENVAKQSQSLVANAFKGMEDALINFVRTGKLDFTALADSIIADLLRISLKQQVLGPLAGIFASFGGAGSGYNMPGGESIPSAKGNVFSGPGISAYSSKVVSSPTLFPFAHGTGLMGEAGPEAIMPLKRDASGRLGVRASGSGVNYAPVINIDSRADQSEVARLVTKAIDLGNKQLVDMLQRQGKLA